MIRQPSPLLSLSRMLVVCVGLSACGKLIGSPPVRLTPVPVDDDITPLVCDALDSSARASVVDSIGYAGGPDRIRIRFPDNDPIAELVVPREAVTRRTIFTLSAPPATTAVYVAVVAADSVGSAVNSFSAPLTLVLRPQERNCQEPPRDPDFGIYLYNIGDMSPSSRLIRSEGGNMKRGGELEDPWLKEARAGALVDGFSGFILAQGRH